MTPFPSLGSSIISSQNAAVFFSFFSCFLFSTLTRACSEREGERERNGYGTSSDDSSDYWVIKNLGGCWMNEIPVRYG